MGTYTKTIGTKDTDTSWANPYDTGINIPGSEYITKIEMNLSTSTGWWRNVGSNTFSMDFYSRTSNQGSGANWSGEYDKLTTITLNGNGTDRNNKSWTLSEANGKKYSGHRLYLHGWGSTTSILLRNATNGVVTLTVTTAVRYTKVVAGNKIYKTDLSQAATPDDATYIKYRTKFSAGTKCEASTFNSQVLGF